MEPVKDDIIVAKLRELLQTADMETTTGLSTTSLQSHINVHDRQ